MRDFNRALNCELGPFCLSKSGQCDALRCECFGQKTLMSTLVENSSRMTCDRLSVNVFSFCDKKLRATLINLRGLDFVFDTDGQTPSMIQVVMSLFEARQIRQNISNVVLDVSTKHRITC